MFEQFSIVLYSLVDAKYKREIATLVLEQTAFGKTLLSSFVF